MKKIISKISDWCKNVCAKREGQSNFKRGLIIGLAIALVIIVILVLVLWLSGVWDGKKDDSQPANPIAEAKVIVLTSTHCGNKCWDTSLFIDALKSRSIKITDVETLKVDGWWPWSKGKALAKKLQVTKVPTVVVETDFSKNPDLAAFFTSTLGNTVDNQFVLTKILAPYYDLALNKLKGEILVTYLTDESCKTCYDVKTHATALENLGVPTNRAKTVDISSPAGKDLVEKYKITKAPTILISGEVSEYLVFTQAWADVGIVADDGTYIFTNLDLMGDYKDLTTGTEVKADATKASGSATTQTTATTK
ncbi:MAG: hypothetical protein WC473_00825 [Patescibacteria group bacterium]|jgi:hypothetical protein